MNCIVQSHWFLDFQLFVVVVVVVVVGPLGHVNLICVRKYIQNLVRAKLGPRPRHCT